MRDLENDCETLSVEAEMLPDQFQSEPVGEQAGAPDPPAILEKPGRVLGAFYKSNVYPHMNIEWGSYPDHSGHHFSPGCNRCHAGDHANDDGKVINADRSVCHTLVAWDEASPEILDLIPSD